MELSEEALSLRIFFGEQDKHQGRPLYEVIVQKARELHLAGATVLRGPMGYGERSRVHRDDPLALSEDLPMLIEIVDTQGKIESFLPVLEQVMGSGLVTLEKVRVLRYGAAAPPA
jgi:PII-like signaling protein